MGKGLRKRRLEELDLRGRQLLLRSDLNAPLANGAVRDDTRLLAALPAIRAARRAGAAVVVASHLGRPEGVADRRFSLDPVARRLSALLGRPVRFDPERAAPETSPFRLPPGEVLLLENLRFHPGETANDPGFARRLAGWGDHYANDAFGTAHRAHASVEACARLFPQAAIGPLLRRETETLTAALTSPRRPFVVVLGGAKVGGKLPVVRSLLTRADRVLIGGAMAYTFLAAAGFPTGRSLVASECLAEARELLSSHPRRFLLPSDHLVVRDPGAAAGTRTRTTDTIPEDTVAFDLGNSAREAFAGAIRKAATVIWNGPMGMFERRRFAGGTEAVARAVASAADRGAATVIGGGDSLAAVHQAGLAARMGHLSTGGGAMLTFLAGRPLPGLEALADA